VISRMRIFPIVESIHATSAMYEEGRFCHRTLEDALYNFFLTDCKCMKVLLTDLYNWENC
jgi:hypothetical protein